MCSTVKYKCKLSVAKSFVGFCMTFFWMNRDQEANFTNTSAQEKLYACESVC